MDVLTLELRDRKGDVRRALLDQGDAHLLGSYTWHICQDGYVRRKSHGRHVYLHRLIIAAAAGQLVDHINGDGLDNRKANLRLCNRAENAGTATSPRTTGQASKASPRFVATAGWRRSNSTASTFTWASSKIRASPRTLQPSRRGIARRVRPVEPSLTPLPRPGRARRPP